MQVDNTEQNADAPPIGPDHQLPPPHESPRRSGGVRALIWFLVLAAFGLLFWIVVRHHQAQTAAIGGRRAGMTGPVAVTTVTARRGSIGVYLDAIGTVTPVYTSTITSQVTGRVMAVRYREGQMVKRGDPLVEIDARPYQAQLLNAQGVLQRDTNLLAQARMDLERYRQAWARQAIPRQTLEDQEKIVLQEEGTVKADQGTVNYDQVQVEFCHITSPIAGQVGLRLVDPGNVVQSGSTTPLVVVTQTRPITVVFTIPEDSLGQVQDQLRHGRTLSVEALDRSEQTRLGSGRLLTLDNQIDTTTGTVKLRAAFPNTDGALFPNQFVNTQLLVKTLEGVTLIPSSAIQHNGEASFVYVITNRVAKIRPIKPGTSDSQDTVVQGINPGDVVANSSFQKLQDGSQITISKIRLPATEVESNAP